MKQCINCLSENVSTIVEKNHILFYCSNCKSKNSNVIDNEGVNFSTKQNGLVKHVTVGALIEKEDSVLLIKRKKYPFGYGIPSTHLHYEEEAKDALDRLFIDKIGLELKSSNLIFHQTLVDQCRYGGELHDCYLFNCSTDNFVFTGTDQTLVWRKKSELNNIDLIPNAKLLFSRINLLENNVEPTENKPINKMTTTKERSILDSLPFSIVIFDHKGKHTFINHPAEKLLKTIKKDNESEIDGLNDALARLAKKTISSKSTFAENFKTRHRTYNLVSQPLIYEDRKCGATIIIGDVSHEKEREISDILAHQTSITLCSNTNFTTIARAIMKKMFYSMDISSASLMILNNDELKTAFHYSTITKTRRNPLSFRLGRGVAGWVAQNKTMLAVPNTDKDSLFIGSALPSEKSLLCLPIISNDKALGVINLTKARDNYFTEKEMSTASIVANRIALAIENEKLYQQIKTDEKKTASIIENSAEGIAVEKTSGEIIIWNKRMREITGFATAIDFMEVNSEHVPRITDAINHTAKLNKDYFYEEMQITNADGEKIWVGGTFSLVRDETKAIDFLIVQVRDLTKERSFEAQQKEFIYTTTHELRTPITAIKGYLSMILDGDTGEVNPKQKKYFNKVYESTENLVLLVEDLLKTARIEEDRLEIEKKPFGLNTIAGDTINDFRSKAKNKGLKLEGKGWKGDIVVDGDSDKTKQALSNLVDNAIKYTTKGSIIIKIQKEEGYGKLTIDDTGVGIPRKEQEAVFSKFYRVPNSESVKAGGTGLGLFIVKNLIEKQGGEVQIKSRLGKGTSISILLPLVVKEKI